MPRPREFDRTKVIRRAMDVFWRKGYEATSISDLTEATGLKPGSLYNAFGSKHAIYLEALDYYQTQVGSCLFDVLTEPISGREAIERLFHDLVEEELRDPEQLGCMGHKAILERASHDQEVSERSQAGVANGKAMFRQALARAQAAGEINPDLDLDHAAAYLMSMVYAIRTVARTTKSRAELNGIVQVALAALK